MQTPSHPGCACAQPEARGPSRPMSDLHRHLTPAMRQVLLGMEKARRAPLHELTPHEARQAYLAGAQVLELPARPMPRVEPIELRARDGHALAARLYAPLPAGGPALPALVFFHGGGFTIGGPDTHDVLCRELSHLAGCAVVSVDYRLAPEHRFPTAVHDAWDALVAVHARAAELGLDARRLAVGGDSAGGTLSAVCALLARDAGLGLALQLLIYPGTVADQGTDSHRRFEQGFILSTEMIDWFFGHYIDAGDRHDWRFAPMNAEDASGVAPAWLALAECDPLHDEGLLYADKLRMAGVPVDLEVYRGVTHEFIKMGRVLPEARRFHADASRALRSAFALAPDAR